MKKAWKGDEIRKRIAEVLPERKVIPRHAEGGHFYEVREVDQIDIPDKVSIENGEHIVHANIVGPVYPSVTGKLQILKDEGLINYKMNRAIEYVFANYKGFTDSNVMEHLEKASRVSQDILEDAGDIGTRIHKVREDIFNAWIKTGVRPDDFLSFIPKEEEDIRITSAIRALKKFCEERDYIPVRCELLVYSHEHRVGGTLDDIGLMRKELRQGIVFENGRECDHLTDNLEGSRVSSILENPETGKHTCIRCGYQYRYELVLMDLKTSNAFKDHYFFQVALYCSMFWKLTGMKPERCFILKVSKEDGNYKIEDLKKPAKLAQYARAMLKTNEAIGFIRELRKDNQKIVIKV